MPLNNLKTSDKTKVGDSITCCQIVDALQKQVFYDQQVASMVDALSSVIVNGFGHETQLFQAVARCPTEQEMALVLRGQGFLPGHTLLLSFAIFPFVLETQGNEM